MTSALSLDYEPREAFIPFHQRTARFSAMCCHRRAGKTVACIHDIVLRASYTHKKNAKFAYVGPLRQQTKEIAWVYLKDATNNIRLGDPRESDLKVTLYNGATIQLYGADNPDALRGLYFDGIVLDEYGDMRPSIWGEVVLPTLIDRRGWAVFIGTMKGKNHFFKTLERAREEEKWFYMSLKGSESGILAEEDLLELKAQLTEAQYEQEIECNPNAAVMGTYYSKLINEAEIAGRVHDFPHDPGKPVHVSADLGYTDSTAFWFWQVDERGPIMIDYFEDDGLELEEYFKMLDGKGYEYANIWLPHDAKAATLQTGRSTIEQFQIRKYPVKAVPKLAKQHGIDAVRMMLPNVRFDRNNCAEGIEALRAYRRKWNEKTQQYSNEPAHDWASDGSDAFRYFALVTDEKNLLMDENAKKEPEQPKMTLDALWAERENDSWRDRVIRI